jgi:hypothetical protein
LRLTPLAGDLALQIAAAHWFDGRVVATIALLVVLQFDRRVRRCEEKFRFPLNRDVHRRNPGRPLHVDSSRLVRAISVIPDRQAKGINRTLCYLQEGGVEWARRARKQPDTSITGKAAGRKEDDISVRPCK